MPTVTKTWTFTGNAEGLVRQTYSDINCTFNYYTNYIGFHYAPNFNDANCSAYKSSTADTWETWGVPSGATVTSVQITAWSKWGAVANGSPPVGQLKFYLIDSDANSILSGGAYLVDEYITVDDGGWVAGSNEGSKNIIAGKQASTTAVRLAINFSALDYLALGDVYGDIDNIELTITYSGTNATMVANTGSYTHTGVQPNFDRKMYCDAGAYNLTGVVPRLNRSMRTDVGSYTHTGNEATLAGKMISCDAGTYSVSGVEPSFGRTYQVVLDTGSYNHNGLGVGLYLRGLIGEIGTHNLTGINPNIYISTIVPSVGAYNQTGTTAYLYFSKMRANAGAYNMALVPVSKYVAVDTGAYNLTGVALASADLQAPSFASLRNTEGLAVVWTVHLHIPAFEEFAEQNWYWSTADYIDIGDNNSYLPYLQSCKGRHQRDRGNDYAEFVVVNQNNELYQTLVGYEDLFEQGRITIRECVEIEDEYFVSEIRFVGYLADFTLDDDSKTIKFTANSDMSRTGQVVGGRVLTRERCGAEFNYNGTESAQYHLCGWQTAQGGNPTYCSRYLRGIDSCESHNNEHRFFAVTGLIDTPIQIITDPAVEYPTGFDYESRACFTANTLVLMADWSFKPINELRIGDKVMGYNIFDNDSLVESEVKLTFSHRAKEFYLVHFDHAVIETTKDHLFYIGNKEYVPPVGLNSRIGYSVAVGLDKERKLSRDKRLGSKVIADKTELFNIHTTSNNYIVTDKRQLFFYFVHNVKYEYYLA